MKTKFKKLSEVDLSKLLPAFGETAELELEEITVPIKIISPLINFEWYLYEYDKESRIGMAFVKGDFDECGTVSIDELEDILCVVDNMYEPTSLKNLTNW